MSSKTLAPDHPVARAHELRSTLDENHARRVLGVGPWCWPEPHTTLCDYALDLRGEEPCDVLAGEALLVAVSSDAAQGALVLLRAGQREEVSQSMATQFVREAVSAWDVARLAVARNLPVFSETHLEQPLASKLTHDRGCEFRELDGRSFGLGFALSMASTTLTLATRPDIIASATIDEWGVIGPVDHLERKLETIAAHAPRTTHVLVCRTQCATLEENAKALGLKLCPVAHFLDALDIAFDNSPYERLIEQAQQQRKIESLVDALFRLALLGNQAQMEWAPVQKFAELAFEQLSESCSESQRLKLRFAREVATRHSCNEGALHIPPEEFLGALPHPHRIRLIAHLVQQSADTGSPSASACKTLALGVLPDSPRDAFPDHLRLMGALGRLLAVDESKREEAFGWQKKSAEGWFALWRYDDLTYAISAMYQLAGGLQSSKHYDEALGLARRAERMGGKGCQENEFVLVYQGMALARLGRWKDSMDLLEALLERGDLRAKVASRATRWLVYVCEKLGKQQRASQLRAALDQQIEELRHTDRGLFLDLTRALIELDAALEAPDPGTAKQCFSRIKKLQPSLVKNLIEANNIPIEQAPAFIQRAFPY